MVSAKALVLGSALIVALGLASVNKRDASAENLTYWTDYRLPQDLTVSKYDLTIHPNLTTLDFSGQLWMSLKVVNATDKVLFHTRNLNFTEVKVFKMQNITGTYLNPSIRDEAHLHDLEMYQITLPVVYPVNTRLAILIRYQGKIRPKGVQGLYRSTLKVGNSTSTMISTQCQALLARQVFPCLDEPSFKARFAISIVREGHHTSLSNAARYATYQSSACPACEVDFFEDTPPLSTYLFALAVLDHNYTFTYSNDGTLIRIFAHESKMESAVYTLNRTLTFYNYYVDYFNLSLPLTKFDYVWAFNHRAAMENWGLVLSGAHFMLYDPRQPSEAQRQLVSMVISHEVVHHWFGNLVTPKWWDELWLNEGVATYFHITSQKAVGTVFDEEEGYYECFKLVCDIDSSPSSHAVKHTINSSVEVEAAFDQIAYNKGALLVWLIESLTSKETLRDGLRHYIRTHKYQNVDSQDFAEAIQTVSSSTNISLRYFINEWVRQAGYPLVSVYNIGSALRISQKRFLMYQEYGQPSPLDSQVWPIPFTYTTSQNPNKEFLVVLTKDETIYLNVPSVQNSSWIKGNVGGRGLYRVEYRTNNWMDLSQQLKENHMVFSVGDRRSLVDDVFMSSRLYYLDYTVAFSFLEYLANETSTLVWTVALEHLEYLLDRLRLKEEYRLMEAYVWGIAGMKLEQIGWDASGNHKTRQLRGKLLALAKPNKTNTDILMAVFDQWKANATMEIDSDLRNYMFGAIVSEGSVDDWEIILQKAIAEKYHDTDAVWKILARTPYAHLLEKYLSVIPTVNPRQGLTLLVNVAKSLSGRLLAWRYLRKNWVSIVERLGGIEAENMKHAVDSLKYFDNKFDYDEVREFFEDKELGTGENNCKILSDHIFSKAEWTRRKMARVQSLLITKMMSWAVKKESSYPFRLM